ncbi:uncharacterized protein GGS25DRAFT_229785 [Hypoxylon fragiforme]|uniref:uncharacterized protein n=1 Tax=Hypoxylon fragiforme TaxID=63214 RepID=UPI0020C6F755|nr:uncharacterized protein GGS25DRAFT_229785 [Hypoxylon fragiforme]KAI2609712.1 hypothetical protein GGS25DRAFT_229785 [Hypoxylon fragiforme]
MQPSFYRRPSSLHSVLFLFSLTFTPFCSATVIQDLQSNYFAPSPPPEDGPSLSAGALRNTKYLPAQIGGIVGSYALSLILVAAILLLLAKKRREHLSAGQEDQESQYPYQLPYPPPVPAGAQNQYQPGLDPPKSPVKNFSYPTPLTPLSPVSPGGPEGSASLYIVPSLHSTSTLGINPLVDPRVVAADREMAQQQLEEMYRLVMEQEAAKEAGVTLDQPPPPISQSQPPKQGILKRGKNKPANLDLAAQPGEEKHQSRTSSLLSAFKSPRKKNSKAISISSPIMTPMSGTFPRYEGEEMSAIPPRHYAPASPPPVPTDQAPYARASKRPSIAPITPPDFSPESTQSIDERLGHLRGNSQYTEPDPTSAASEQSTTPLVGLPSSPKPSVTRFPSLPTSPKPGSTFQVPSSPRTDKSFSRPNAPSAVRTGGALPLRAYEPALSSPSAQTTKQTTFERAPLSPSGLRTPWTGAPVPYTPYQPFSPVIPVTPSLVTKADRKRMKQLQPKTPTMEMVKNSDEIW